MTRHKLPKGFLAAGMHCGVKKKRKDLALFVSEKSAKAAAMFTTNRVKAAPVLLGIETLRKTSRIRAIIANSGNANCMTGKQGIKDARAMVKKTAAALGISEKEVLVSSTGVIGKFMPMKPIRKGIPVLARALSPEGFMDAADGIMTTDRFHKISVKTFTLGDKEVTMAGVAKGAGMINPNMATMLCYILTDANISAGMLKKSLRAAVASSFNSITVDGDMSTNDTVVVMANGAAKNAMINKKGADLELFRQNLEAVTMELAEKIVRDGEGATRFVRITVKGAATPKDAKRAASAIANSLLTKCAIHGGDPNWGRVASSVGMSGVRFDPARMEITLDGVLFFKDGDFQSPEAVSKVFKEKDVAVDVNLHMGREEATVYTCDISKKYVAINSYYTT